MNFKAFFLPLVLVISTSNFVFAQINKADWKIEENRSSIKSTQFFKSVPSKYLSTNINLTSFDAKLISIKQEISIPSPEGNFTTFIITPSKVVADEVSHLYSIKTFIGYEKENPSILISCDISNQGFHAAVYNGDKTYFVEPTSFADEKHLVYYKSDHRTEKVKCGVVEALKIKDESGLRAPNAKRTYRLAIVAMGEYSQQFGGSPYSANNVLNAMASGVNMMAPIWLRDMGVEFNLVSTTALVFQDPNTDPFDINDQFSLLTDCHTQCVSALGVNGFDVGHIIAWENTGGLASLGVICDNTSKGEGFSGTNEGLSTLWVDYVAHELGHQFGSNHNFSAQCYGNSVAGHRFEPGEGSSIMCYANVCLSTDSYTSASDPYFHYNSIDQMQTYLNTTSCASSNSAGNASDPIPNAMSNITVPKQTPFVLIGDASDANDGSNALTYNWIQYDGSGAVASGSPNCSSTNSPLFRFRPPVADKYRNFPQYSDVLSGNNNAITWEKLPCVARTMNFALTVRDNNATYGRVVKDDMIVTVANTGPFNVTAPNGGESITGNATVTWSVNGTNAHCANVDILLSTDSGISYSILADATPNDGSESITFPVSSTNARILIRCDVAGGFRSASTFYDVSDADFSISSTGLTCYTDLTNSTGLATVETGIKDYESSTFIETTAATILQNGSVVDYDATTTIELKDGFEVVLGAVFNAFIDGCNNGGGGSNVGETSNELK